MIRRASLGALFDVPFIMAVDFIRRIRANAMTRELMPGKTLPSPGSSVFSKLRLFGILDAKFTGFPAKLLYDRDIGIRNFLYKDLSKKIKLYGALHAQGNFN